MTLTDPRRGAQDADAPAADRSLADGPGADGATRLSTAPDPDATRRITGDGVAASLRRSWRQLTSMRTALLLLFLLAMAAIPGSVLPQHRLNQLKVDDFYRAHPALAPILDKVGLFDVFAAPWFAAIYLLLFVSLIGCLIPRIRLHARAMLRRPPAAPRFLDRLPHATSYETAGSPAEVAPRLRRLLRGWRTEVVRENDDGAVAICAERGYLRETGNLLFHVALLVLLAGVAMGSLWGWKATRLVVEGETFCNTVSQYDEFTPGRFVQPGNVPPFCVKLNKFTATYQPTGEARSFDAKIRYGGPSGDLGNRYDLAVNHPLRHLGTRTYLLSHGFAPVITVTDPSGQTFRQPWPFLPQDTNYTSDGVVKLADARPKQIGIQGVFTPTRDPADRFGLHSTFPAPRDPALSMVVYEGNLGLDSGVPQSVYSLDQTQIQHGQLKVVGRKLLLPGQSFRLADGTKIRFDGLKEWATLQVSHDPGEVVVLIAAVCMVLGLLGSLRVRRRRLWFRLAPAGGGEQPGRTVVSLGGLARTDADSFADEFSRIAVAARADVNASPEEPRGAVAARKD